MSKEKKVVIVKKSKKTDHAGHGGSWKVAYADFMTAMMAFFLLMWLLNTASEEQKAAISYYFTTGSMMDTSVTGGETILSGSADAGMAESASMFTGYDGSHAAPYLMNDEQRIYFANREQELFDRAKIALEESLRADPELFALIDNLIITKTPEGLNIQLVDQIEHVLFSAGSDTLTTNGLRLTAMLAKVLSQMPQQMAIEGHTDSVPFAKTRNYSNWELSVDRALAFRRRMIQLNINPKQIVRVAGYASEKPYLPNDTVAPQNRRISVTLLSDYTEEAIKDAKERALRELEKDKKRQEEQKIQ